MGEKYFPKILVTQERYEALMPEELARCDYVVVSDDPLPEPEHYTVINREDIE